MSTQVIFETHSTSEDNENGIATGWLGGRLSALGREQARELGARRRGIARVYSSDLNRAVETAAIAFPDRPVTLDWRLRECDYGAWNGMPRERLVSERVRRIDEPFPGGESWRQAVARVDAFLAELREGPAVVIGHIATHWAFEQRYAGRRRAQPVKPRIRSAVTAGTSSCGQWPTPASSTQSACGKSLR
jgi:2,3-bisphosphoglycerate-dependent phosphoglycerate mutase